MLFIKDNKPILNLTTHEIKTMRKKFKTPISPTIEELKAIENENIEPLTDEDIKLIFESAAVDTDFDTFNPFFDDFEF